MIRTYHGCQIESLPSQFKIEAGRVLCDGYTHTVTLDGKPIAECGTLGEAIAEAKKQREPYTYQPLVEE